MVTTAVRAAERRGRISDRFGLLLLLLTGAFIGLGFGGAQWQRVLEGAFQVGALVVAFLATGVIRTRRPLILLVTLGMVSWGLTAGSGGTGTAFGIASIVNAAVMVTMLVSVLLRVLRHRHVTIQTLFGAVCAYVLIGLLFTNIYGAFDGLGSQPLFGQPVARSVYSYFSFVALTTVGFGDYSAHVEVARRFVAMESVLGQVFIATTLARLVALFKGAAGRPPGDVGPGPAPGGLPVADAAAADATGTEATGTDGGAAQGGRVITQAG